MSSPSKTEKDEARPPLPPRPKIRIKKAQVVEFDKDGLPKANRANYIRMTLDDLEKVCQRGNKGWTLQKHIDPLLIELADVLDVPSKATRADKCHSLIQYKKDKGSKGLTKAKTKRTETYEMFGWMGDTSVRYRGQVWELPHSSNFKKEIATRFSEHRLQDGSDNVVDPDDPQSPFWYQQSVVEYLDPRTPYRSALAYHGLGSGKTRTAILTSIRFIKDGKKVLFLVPGALRGNLYEELYKWGPEGVRIPDYKNLKPDERKEKEKAANKVISFHYDILTYNERGLYSKLIRLLNPETGFLEDRLIVIDEIHDFVSRMAKPMNQSRKVYHFLMDKVVNCKFLGLSGTPNNNNAHELGIMFNVFRGKMHGDMLCFPESEDSFNDLFVNYFDRSVSNQYLFKRRISGLVSYYAGSTDFSKMPEKVKMPVYEIEMSDHQYQLYLSERYSESKKEQKKKGPDSGSSTGSAFRTYSRMVSNFAFPEDIDRPKPISARDHRSYNKYKSRKRKHNLEEDTVDEVKPGASESFGEDDGDRGSEEVVKIEASGRSQELTKKERQLTYLNMLDEAYDWLKDNADKVFGDKGLKKYSPKFLRMIQNIHEGPGSQGIIYVYTEFRILEGVRLFGACLEHRGYEKIDFTKIKTFDDLKAVGKAKRYGIISSDEDAPQRKIFLDLLRHPENSHGEYIKILMGTSASSQGINLERVTQVHVTEDYWNKIREEQVEGRAARYKSHVDLPKDEQKVYIYKYRMVLSEVQKEDAVKRLDNTKESVSTEEYIHDLAETKHIINSQFLKMLKEAAFDCNLNYLVNVKLDPDLVCLDVPEDAGEYLYMPNIYDDPLDYEYNKRIKKESYKIGEKVIKGEKYGFKVIAHGEDAGKPILSQITYKGRLYPQVIILYDLDLLKNGIEVKRKYYVLGLNRLIDANEIR